MRDKEYGENPHLMVRMKVKEAEIECKQRTRELMM